MRFNDILQRSKKSCASSSNEGAYLRIEGLSKKFDGGFALRDFDLSADEGDFVVLVGPSGCGKSTLLRLLAGLEEPSKGRVILKGRDITEEEPARRDIAMVFQDYALYPHMSAFDNIAFPLRMRKMPRIEMRLRVESVAERLGIGGLLERRPAELSGGQQQRVAIARALVREPALFLMDEPLSNLDAKLRVQMRGELARLHRETGATVLYVTHDQTEALTLATKVVVLRGGEIQQVGTPRDLYDAPADTFVAGFIGNPPMNLLGTMEVIWPENKRWAVSRSSTSLAEEAGRASEIASDGSAPLVGVRPESLVLASQDVKLEEGQAMVHGILVRTEFTGATSYAFAEIAGGRTLVARLPEIGAVVPEVGESVTLIFDSTEALFFDPETGRRLSRLS